MASRDHFTVDLTCPECGHSGVVEASENDYPFQRNPGFQYDDFPAGFSLAKYGTSKQSTVVRCQCGKEFTA